MGKRTIQALIIIFLLANLLAKSTDAKNLMVSAYVPVSDFWASSVSNNSEVTSFWQKNTFNYVVNVRGPNKEELLKNLVSSEVYFEGKLISKSITKSKELQKYEAKKNGNYKIKFTDITWERSITLKNELNFYHGKNLLATLLSNFNLAN